MHYDGFGRLGNSVCVLACAVTCLVLATPAASDSGPGEGPGRIGVGLNYPGIGLRAMVGEWWMAEARGQYEREAQVTGVRVYRYAFPEGRYYPYLAAEADYVRFDDEGLKADGIAAGIFGGLECFIRRKLSFQFDIGPAYVGLEEAGISVNSISFLVNFGLTYYLR